MLFIKPEDGEIKSFSFDSRTNMLTINSYASNISESINISSDLLQVHSLCYLPKSSMLKVWIETKTGELTEIIYYL